MVCVECCLLFEEQAFLVAMRSRLQVEHQVPRTVACDVTQLTHDLLLHVRPVHRMERMIIIGMTVTQLTQLTHDLLLHVTPVEKRD